MKKSPLQLYIKSALAHNKSENMKHIDVKFEVKQVTEVEENGEQFYEFEGYGSTFNNVDLVDDIILPGAFTESLRVRTPVLLWQHDMNMPLGVFVDIFEDSRGLMVKGRMPKDDTFVSGRVVPQMKVGSVNQMSIGFSIPSRDDYFMENGIRHIRRVDLFEISLVTIPANPEAVITSNVKNFTFNEKQISYRDLDALLSSELSKIVDEQYGDSDDAPKYYYVVDIFQDYFIANVDEVLYQCNYTFDEASNTVTVDPNKIEVRRETNYIPINTVETRQGDKPDEERQGDKPDYDRQIDDDDKPDDERQRRPYEQKDEKQFTINDVFSIKSKRDFEKLLRDSGRFSKAASTFLSSFFQESRSDSEPEKIDKNTSVIEQLKSFRAELEKN